MALAHAAAPRLPIGQSAGTPRLPTGHPPEDNPDYLLRIAPVTVELDRSHILSTVGYNGAAPGPLLRLRAGRRVGIDVVNDTDTPELVHWHGLLIPPEVDGTQEEGSPVVPPHGRRHFELTPGPAGSRWYHSHAMAMDDLHKGGYTGQFGFVYVEDGNNPGRYDQELFLALRDWEPFFTATMDDEDDDTHHGPLLEKPATLNTDPDGLGVVVEYAGQHHQPQWIDPPQAPWDYTIFGTANSSSPAPQKTIELIFEKLPGAAGK